MGSKVQIMVTVKREGYHKWVQAPEEVSFLRNEHRHIFTVRIGIPVYHLDREAEFIMEQRKLNLALNKHWAEKNGDLGSCEMIATFVLNEMSHVRWCEVWEDDENGAKVER